MAPATELELRNPEDARLYLLTGLCLTRALQPSPSTVRAGLEICWELAIEGMPVPPSCLAADIGALLSGGEKASFVNAGGNVGYENLLCGYEDYLLGKIVADRSFDRATDVVRRWTGRDRVRGIAYVIDRFRERAGLPAVFISPAIIRAMLEEPADGLHSQAWQMMGRAETSSITLQRIEECTAIVRSSGDVLGPEDLFELERGTALSEFSQRLALRQAICATQLIESRLPQHPPRPRQSRRQVPSALLDDDVYPVGGFASVSNRGSVESLLHSQLAFMETDANASRPDLFDIKFVRDELLYYSRDENQFLRRRRRFAIELQVNLATARFKDAHSPYQRIILVLAAVVSLINKSISWLEDDSLTFAIYFPVNSTSELAPEHELLSYLMQDKISAGVVILETEVPKSSAAHATRLIISTHHGPSAKESHQLIIDSHLPRLRRADSVWQGSDQDDAVDGYAQVITQLLANWLD